MMNQLLSDLDNLDTLIDLYYSNPAFLEKENGWLILSGLEEQRESLVNLIDRMRDNE